MSALRKWLICALLLAVASLQALAQQSPFNLTYQTTAPNETIVFPAFGPGYDFTIDWGDGTVENYTDDNVSHESIRDTIEKMLKCV